MKYLSFFTIFLFTLFQFKAVAQSGWMKNKNSLYTQLSVHQFSSNQYYATNGTLFDEGNNFSSQQLMLYGEYGISDRLTGLLNVPLLQLNSFSNTDVVASIGDVQLGAKYALTQKIPLSISVEASIPTGDGVQFATSKTVNELGLRDRINLSTSDGEFNVWTTLALSQSKGDWYASVFGSLNLRTQGFSHQMKLGGEIGYQAIDDLWLIAKLNVLESLSDSPNTSVPFIYGEGTTYTATNLQLMYALNENWRLIAGYADYFDFLVNRRNIYDAPSFSLGLAFDLK
ncbi:MAG: hypothetical protein AAF847_13045 [Bacteroidota bacterium]